MLGFALGRWAILAGIVFLFLGLAPLGGLYVYEAFFYTTGDTSSMGMLSTLMAILFAPFGLVLIVFGLLKGN